MGTACKGLNCNLPFSLALRLLETLLADDDSNGPVARCPSLCLWFDHSGSSTVSQLSSQCPSLLLCAHDSTLDHRLIKTVHPPIPCLPCHSLPSIRSFCEKKKSLMLQNIYVPTFSFFPFTLLICGAQTAG